MNGKDRSELELLALSSAQRVHEGGQWVEEYVTSTDKLRWAPVSDVQREALTVIEAAVDVEAWARCLTRSAVAVARERGVTWREIGDQLGLSRQAAQQRFSGQPDAPTTVKDWPSSRRSTRR